MTKTIWVRLLLLLLAVGLAACEGINYNLNSYQVRVGINPGEAGFVTPSQDTIVNEGIEITLQAQSNEGYVFDSWSGDIERDENPATILVYENYDIIANYVKKEYELGIQKNGKGEILERLVSAKTYEHGSIVELTANPGTGYEFVEWTGDISSSENPATIEMDEPKNVTATFRVKPTSAVLDVDIDWQTFNSLGGGNEPTISDSITHFGLHFAYDETPSANVKKSVLKTDSDSSDVLTVETQAGGSGRLLATAVRTENNSDKAFFFGVKENVNVALGNQYNWTVDDFTWRKATWRIENDSLALVYEDGQFVRDRTIQTFELLLLLNSPFNTSQNPNILDLFVVVSENDPDTRSEKGTYTNGFREWFIEAENEMYPKPDTTSHFFFPYLSGDEFNLPAERYLIKEKGSFRVVWQ
ncbi:MAG: hypothetical protein U5J95_11190 [Balneolaceae bacterium]|nr:hypothetical protein [Balneolaceae bacterium]